MIPRYAVQDGVRGAVIGFALASASCGGGVPDGVHAPVEAHVVVIPALEDEDVGAAPSPAPTSTCPADTFAEHGQCVRVVASPEIPTWEPPTGHLDPCATWTSDKGIFDCDPSNERAPDGGSK